MTRPAPQQVSGAQPFDVVRIELSIRRREYRLLDLRLRHQEPIKRVAMVHGQCGYLKRMSMLHGKPPDAALRHARLNIRLRGNRQR